MDNEVDYFHCGLNGRLDRHVCRWKGLRQLRHTSVEQVAAVSAFTGPLFVALTACVMNRLPVKPENVFPLKYLIDYVKVYKFVHRMNLVILESCNNAASSCSVPTAF